MFLLKVSTHEWFEKIAPCTSHIIKHVGLNFLLKQAINAAIPDAPIVSCLARTQSALFFFKPVFPDLRKLRKA